MTKADMEMNRKAPVQATHGPPDKRRPAGWITWAEHLEAWEAYQRKYGSSRSAQRIAERGGFCWYELNEFLGREPQTWEPRTSGGHMARKVVEE